MSTQLREVTGHAEDLRFEAEGLYDEIVDLLEEVSEAASEPEDEPDNSDDVLRALKNAKAIVKAIVGSANTVIRELRAVDSDDKPATAAEATIKTAV